MLSFTCSERKGHTRLGEVTTNVVAPEYSGLAEKETPTAMTIKLG